MRILFAEDDVRLGNLIQHMLQKEGYEIDWVRAGDLAFEYATDAHYSLAFRMGSYYQSSRRKH